MGGSPAPTDSPAPQLLHHNSCMPARGTWQCEWRSQGIECKEEVHCKARETGSPRNGCKQDQNNSNAKKHVHMKGEILQFHSESKNCSNQSLLGKVSPVLAAQGRAVSPETTHTTRTDSTVECTCICYMYIHIHTNMMHAARIFFKAINQRVQRTWEGFEGGQLGRAGGGKGNRKGDILFQLKTFKRIFKRNMSYRLGSFKQVRKKL